MYRFLLFHCTFVGRILHVLFVHWCDLSPMIRTIGAEGVPLHRDARSVVSGNTIVILCYWWAQTEAWPYCCGGHTPSVSSA